jgi:hypothetical protein
MSNFLTLALSRDKDQIRKGLNVIINNIIEQIYAQRPSLNNRPRICYWSGVGGKNYLAGDARLKYAETYNKLGNFLWLMVICGPPD